MSTKLRVIYQNLADSATITASPTASGVTSTANLIKDSKSLVYRGAGTSVTLTVNLAASSIVGGVAIPFCNLTSTATIRVRGYSAASGTGTLLFDTSTMDACPYQPLGLWAWGSIPLGLNTYAYGGGTYARCWLPNNEQLACLSLVIDIVDTANTTGFIELSRLVVGAYWSPKYNTSFGLSAVPKDMSEHARTESGDISTNRGVRYNTLNFDLKYMDPSDRTEFAKIMRGSGLPKAMFVSLFPEDADPGKEQLHQIYGKLSQLGGISHPMYEMYSTTVDIEEV
jgi:hypothetical protein